MRPLIKINQTYGELAAAIAAAITRSGTKLFHHKGSFYTEDFKLLSPERFTTWLETANICSFYNTRKEPVELANLSAAQAKIILGSEVFLTTFNNLHETSQDGELAFIGRTAAAPRFFQSFFTHRGKLLQFHDISHHWRKLYHYLTETGRAIFDSGAKLQHPLSHQALHSGGEQVGSLRAAVAQHVGNRHLFLIAQSREDATDSFALSYILQTLDNVLLKREHQNTRQQEPGQLCIFVCYPVSDPTAPRTHPKGEQAYIPTAYLLTEAESSQLFQKIIHSPATLAE